MGKRGESNGRFILSLLGTRRRLPDSFVRVFKECCVVIPLILDVRLMDAPIGVTQDLFTFILQ